MSWRSLCDSGPNVSPGVSCLSYCSSLMVISWGMRLCLSQTCLGEGSSDVRGGGAGPVRGRASLGPSAVRSRSFRPADNIFIRGWGREVRAQFPLHASECSQKSGVGKNHTGDRNRPGVPPQGSPARNSRPLFGLDVPPWREGEAAHTCACMHPFFSVGPFWLITRLGYPG